MPASHFFEFTGTTSPKSKWKFSRPGEEWFCFAGLWRPMPEGGDAFTLLTTEPGPDVAPVHDRQMVVLDRSNWHAWLNLSRPEGELLTTPLRWRPDGEAGPLKTAALSERLVDDQFGVSNIARRPAQLDADLKNTDDVAQRKKIVERRRQLRNWVENQRLNVVDKILEDSSK